MSQKLKYFLMSIVGFVALSSVFMFVNPDGKPLIYVFIPVVLLWITLYYTAKLIMLLLIPKVTKLQTVFAFVGVSLLILLFLLSGIGQLTARDIVLVSVLALISAFYFYRTWA